MMLTRAFAACVLLLANPALAAVDKPAAERAFQAWLKSDIWPAAKSAGVSRATFDAAFNGVTLDWSLPELTPPGAPQHLPPSDTQAEFGSPRTYFNESRLNNEVQHGRQRLKAHANTIAAIEQRYGVPGPILIALWARESSFGNAKLPYPAIRALATQAFIGFRRVTFRPELVAALVILEKHDIDPKGMRSSWAGALGQPQFLPTQFLKYAVDFDGDGRRDIWNSVPDVLASMANYLRAEGWNPERGWGLEVKVPGSVTCALEGPEQGKPVDEWARLGVAKVDGSALPGPGRSRRSFLLMPAGRFGPAFLVSENFYVLKEYNYSDLYALYIGHLADRLANNSRFAGAWGDIGIFKRADVQRMQEALVAQGHDVGKVDGLVGFKTRIAVGLWQAKSGKAPTCFPDAALVKSIR
jgi:lytic murein transglycosylase